jgi:hypothetical protein
MLQKFKAIFMVFKTVKTLAYYKKSYLMLYVDAVNLRGCAIRLINELEQDGLKSLEANALMQAVDAIKPLAEEGLPKNSCSLVSGYR